MDVLHPILFYIVSGLLLVCALGVIFAPRIIYSVLCAFVAFVSVAFIYLLLNAPFNAAVQIAIYGVAVSIIFVFAVMMTGFNKDRNLYLAVAPRIFPAVIGMFFTFVAIAIFIFEDSINEMDTTLLTTTITAIFDTTYSIAKGMFTNYIFAFELLSIFLLIVVVGLGVILSFKRGDDR